MSAPTLWEEGQLSGSRVARLAVLAGVLTLAIDVAIFGSPNALFDSCFVLLCVGAALGVRPKDFFVVAVLPPLLLLGLIVLTASVHRGWLADAHDGVLQAVVAGLAHRATGLLAAYLLTLGILAIRQQVRTKRRATARTSPQPNRSGSPAPIRSTTGTPSERSTTVVGSDPHSPESMTAST